MVAQFGGILFYNEPSQPTDPYNASPSSTFLSGKFLYSKLTLLPVADQHTLFLGSQCSSVHKDLATPLSQSQHSD
jgi:hypothetical protein